MPIPRTFLVFALTGPLLALGGAPGARAGDAPAPLARETRTMHLSLHGDADVVFPLFGPVRESEWSPEWAPKFVHPSPPAQGPDGAVFTTEDHSGSPSVWVMTDYDPVARRLRYVILHPGIEVGELSIAVRPGKAKRESTADVTYRFTALSDAGNDLIARWIEHFPHVAPHWEERINERLARRSATP